LPGQPTHCHAFATVPTLSDCEFLRSWEALVTMEEGHGWARRPEIWAMPGKERQRLGRCVAGLALSVSLRSKMVVGGCLR
jgi:hypothetical protein